MKQETKGQLISKVLQELEMLMWEHQADQPEEKFDFDVEAFRASTKIFSDILLEYTFKHQEKNNVDYKTMQMTAYQLGNHIRFLIRNNTGLDSTCWYATEGD